MEGHVYQRGNTWTYVIELPPDPLTGKRKQKSKGDLKQRKKQSWPSLKRSLKSKKDCTNQILK
ncbi:Arm DNA-binding domain-containing protein [Paenibacillus alvei]|uniref:Arm DNA-binding domain-containing protein n=1 Tax=Paenibacillus alvei TaxID=44250 RepID=UPI003B9746A6